MNACPVFDPQKWDNKVFKWENKLFIREPIPSFFHIPFPPMIKSKVILMCTLADNADADIEDKSEMLLLFHDSSPFKSEIFYSVNREIEGADNISMSGRFFAQVFDGPYNRIPKYIREKNIRLSADHQTAKDFYVHYAYCPECQKKYKHNYMIIFAEIM